MSSHTGFCDLCVNDTDPQNLRRILLRLHQLGYETVAINQTVDESVFETEKKKKKKGANGEPVKSAVPEPLDVSELRAEFAKKLTILSRITFVFGDTAKVHALGQSNVLKKYDLYGVVPKSQAALQFACSQSNVDLVAVKSPYPALKFNRKLYLQAVERGVHFEIRYADVLNPATRKYALHYSHVFHIFGKSRNVVVSSGANDETWLRNPYDVINLAALLGLDETKAKASVLGRCKHLLAKAEGRRYGKAVFAVRTFPSQSRTRENSSDDRANRERKRIHSREIAA